MYSQVYLYNMDYQKHYDNLMASRLLLKKQRYIERKNGVYYEGHHIIPKYLGGTGVSFNGLKNDNIVYLTAREHFLAHWLFWRIKRDRQSALAFHKMMSSNKNQNRIVSSRAYEEARLAFSETNKGNDYWKYIKKKQEFTPERRLAHSKIMKGRFAGEKNYFYGKKHTLESRKKISEKAKNRDCSHYKSNKGIKVLLKDGAIIGEFKSSKEIAEYIGSSHSNVRHVLGGTQKTAKGYNIVYKNNLIV